MVKDSGLPGSESLQPLPEIDSDAEPEPETDPSSPADPSPSGPQEEGSEEDVLNTEWRAKMESLRQSGDPYYASTAAQVRGQQRGVRRPEGSGEGSVGGPAGGSSVGPEVGVLSPSGFIHSFILGDGES